MPAAHVKPSEKASTNARRVDSRRRKCGTRKRAAASTAVDITDKEAKMTPVRPTHVPEQVVSGANTILVQLVDKSSLHACAVLVSKSLYM